MTDLKPGDLLLRPVQPPLGLVVLAGRPLQVQSQSVTVCGGLLLLLAGASQLSLTFVKPKLL